MMVDTILDSYVKAEVLALGSDKWRLDTGTGYDNICVFADMNCSGARNNEMFESRCVDVGDASIVEICSCAYNHVNNTRSRLE